MRKSSVILLGISLVAILAFLVYFMSPTKASKNTQKNGTLTDWNSSYSLDSKNPQDLNLFSQLLTFRSKAAVKNNLELNKVLKDQKQTYLFVGQNFALTDSEFNKILAHVRKGNQLIISFDQLNENIRNQFFTEVYNDWIYSQDFVVFTDDTSFNFSALYQMDTVAKRWNLFNEELFYYSEYEILSSFYDTPNFVKIPFGKGEVLLHANPELLMNYQLLKKDGYNHANFFIDQIPEKNEILFLKLADFKTENASSSGDPNYNSGLSDNSYLKLIFQYKSLFYAFLLSIFGVLLYLIFRSKRSLPVVPYLNKPPNSALVFAETMTSIYYQDQKSYDLLLAMRKNFYIQIQKQYQLDLTRKENANRIVQLAEKSSIPIAEVEHLMQHLEEKMPSKIDASFLQKSHALQRDFYVKTGIIKPKVLQRNLAKTLTIKRNLTGALALIVLGLTLILTAFVLLSSAQGYGILLWPIGGIILAYGVFLVNLPLLDFSSTELTVYDFLKRKNTFQYTDLISISTQKTTHTFTFSGNRIVQLNTMQISAYDRTLWEQFMQQIQQK